MLDDTALGVHLRTLAGGDGAEPAFDREHALRTFGYRNGSVDLPDVAPCGVPLGEVLRTRRSATRFGTRALTLDDLAAVLGDGVAVNDAEGLAAGRAPGRRAYPSGGALYGVEALVVARRVAGLPAGCHYYQPVAHRLVHVAAAEASDVARCFANEPVADAGALLLLYADFTRPSFTKYGPKQYRLLLLEAGHLAQNVLLIAAARALCAFPACGFQDEPLSRLAGLAFPSQAVLYVIALGTAA